MDLKGIELPREIKIGDDIINELGEICKELDLKGKALVITGPTTQDIAGKKALEVLKAAGFNTEMNVTNSIEKKDVERLIEQSKSYGFIVAVGGGRIIDIAKYSSFKLSIPYVSFPTAPSHDGLTSLRTTLSDNGKHFSYPIRAPIAIVVDMNIIEKSPYKLIAAGCGDIIAKITAVEDWKLAHEVKGEDFNEYAASIALSAANVVLGSANLIRKMNKKGLRDLVESLISCGIAMSIAGSSRPASGSEHLFSHALDRICENKKSSHGEQVGMGSILCSFLHNLNWKRIRKALKDLNCPTNSQELGIQDVYVTKALVAAKNIREDRYTILNKLNIDDKKAKEVAVATEVIM